MALLAPGTPDIEDLFFHEAFLTVKVVSAVIFSRLESTSAYCIVSAESQSRTAKGRSPTVTHTGSPEWNWTWTGYVKYSWFFLTVESFFMVSQRVQLFSLDDILSFHLYWHWNWFLWLPRIFILGHQDAQVALSQWQSDLVRFGLRFFGWSSFVVWSLTLFSTISNLGTRREPTTFKIEVYAKRFLMDDLLGTVLISLDKLG